MEKLQTFFLQCRSFWIIITEKAEWKWGEGDRHDRSAHGDWGRGGGIAERIEYQKARDRLLFWVPRNLSHLHMIRQDRTDDTV